MYPNLLGQKAYLHLTDVEMGNIIGVSRNTYRQKIKSGRFTTNECTVYCKHFRKPFEYLFATEKEIEKNFYGNKKEPLNNGSKPVRRA